MSIECLTRPREVKRPAPAALRQEELVEPFHAAEVLGHQHRVGIESEQFGFVAPDFAPLPYDGELSIMSLFDRFVANGWAPLSEGWNRPTIGLGMGERSITLEPGGQLELSGAPVSNLHQVSEELEEHRRELEEHSQPLGISWSHVAFHPFATQDQLPWVPKLRYAIMREYLPKVGDGALDMMRRTATIQVNLDYTDEDDAMTKLQLMLRLAPILHAMTAHAPLAEGKLTITNSRRGNVWLRMDQTRSGLIPALWEKPRPGYEDYVNFALEAGMFLFKREGRMIANTGQSFRSFLEHGFEGHRASREDWELHLNTLFPEVRLKRTLEVRCFDAQPEDTAMSIPALCVGLLYDERSRAAAFELVADWEYEQIERLRPQLMADPWVVSIANRRFEELAQRVLELASAGLERRRCLDGEGRNESVYLRPLRQLIDARETPASRLRRRLGNDARPSREAVLEATR